MEEAGQDVPSWLRGEADRFSKHEVQDSFEGVFVSIVSMCVPFATQAPMNLF